jgi:CheY-like chemotaxis protein
MTSAPSRILVVEDETIIGMMIQDTLEDFGYEVIGPAPRLPKALELAEREHFDVALLDVNVAGDLVYPVARKLTERKIPFVFLTGYGKSGIHPDFVARPVLTKPLDPAKLRGILFDLLASR